MNVRKAQPLLGAIAALVTAGVLLSACGSSGSVTEGTGSTKTNQAVKSGGEISVASNAELTGFNCNTSAGAVEACFWAMGWVWPSAFNEGPHFSVQLNDSLLESAEVVGSARTTIVYKIKAAAMWSDGQPIRADDFIYNWKAQSGKGTDVDGEPYDIGFGNGYNLIRSVTGSHDGLTVTVHLTKPFSDWQSLFTRLIPAHIAEKVGWNKGFDTFSKSTVISGGPYMVQSYQPGNTLVLKRNPEYYGRPGNLETVIFRFIPQPSASVSALENGEVQLVYTEPQTDVLAKIQSIENTNVQLANSLGYELLTFNKDPKVAIGDLKVRQAVATAINKKTLAARALGPDVPHQTPTYNRFYVPSQPEYQDNSLGFTANTGKARSILESDGYSEGSEGYFVKGGKPLELELLVPAGDEILSNEAVTIQSELKAAGIKLTIQTVSYDTLFGERLPNDEYELATFSFTATPFVSINQAIYSCHGGLNYSGYCNKNVDSLFEKALSAPTTESAATAYNEIDKELTKYQFNLPLYVLPFLTAYSNTYVNIQDQGGLEGPYWNLPEWGIAASGK